MGEGGAVTEVSDCIFCKLTLKRFLINKVDFIQHSIREFDSSSASSISSAISNLG